MNTIPHKQNIFKEIGDSVYSPTFYARHERLSVGPAFSYFFKFILILALAEAIALCIIAGPSLSRAFSAQSLSAIAAYYPADLTLTVKGGHASTNVKEPYIVPMPADSRPSPAAASGQKQPTNLVVIDTSAASPLDSFKSYDTVLLVTKDYIVSEKSKGQLSVLQLSSFPDFALDRSSITGFIGRVAPLLKLLLPLLFLLMLAGFFIGLTISNLFFLAFISLFTWAASAIMRSGLNYGHCYALGIYALTGPLLLEAVLRLVSVPVPWYASFAIFLISYFVNAHKYYVMVKAA